MGRFLLQIFVVLFDGMISTDPSSIFYVLKGNSFVRSDFGLVKVNHCRGDGSWLGHLFIEKIPLKNLITNLLNIISLFLTDLELLTKHLSVLSWGNVYLRNVSQNDFANFEDFSL